MHQDVLPLLVYIFVTTFTPGPNNITAASSGAARGFMKTLPYLAGMALGFLGVMLLAGFFNLFLRSGVGFVVPYIKWVGFFYMIWLCVSLFLHGKSSRAENTTYSLTGGILLQLVNPKVILYGITLYGLLSERLVTGPVGIVVSAVILAVVGFSSVASWCLMGSSLTRMLGNKKGLFIFNLVMAGLLLYSAIMIVLD